MQPGRLIFDISDMVRFAHENWQVTGIARVSLTLASQSAALCPDLVRVGYFDAVTETYRNLRDPRLLTDAGLLRSHLKRCTSYVKPLKVWKHHPRSVRRGYHQLMRGAALGVQRIKYLIWSHRFAEPELTFESGDRVVSLGGGWGALEAFAHLSRDAGQRARPPEIVALIHDIIPLVMPSWPGTVDQRLFTHWLRQMLAMKASLLFYSRSTERDFQSWCASEGVDRVKARRFRLGDELMTPGHGLVRDDVRRLQGRPYILCIGSVAGRKNGANLIRALRMIQTKRRGERVPLLVLAGSTSRSDLEQMLGGEHGLDALMFISKPSDTELSFLYQHCLFTVFPSLYEGWGLPIGESLWHGKLCATSNSSSMPEVGGDACDYFEPDDPEDIARVLDKLIFDEQYFADRTNAVSRHPLLSWRDSANELLKVLSEPPRILDLAAGSDHIAHAAKFHVSPQAAGSISAPADP